MAVMRVTGQVLAFAWASPYTVVGASIGLVGLCTGGRAQRRGKIVEFYGGGVTWFVTHLPGGQFTLAMTLGHTALGQSDAALGIAREHELVHVRHYERWGIFFGPAYLLASLAAWLGGGRTYRDNRFERETYDAAGGRLTLIKPPSCRPAVIAQILASSDIERGGLPSGVLSLSMSNHSFSNAIRRFSRIEMLLVRAITASAMATLGWQRGFFS